MRVLKGLKQRFRRAYSELQLGLCGNVRSLVGGLPRPIIFWGLGSVPEFPVLLVPHTCYLKLAIRSRWFVIPLVGAVLTAVQGLGGIRTSLGFLGFMVEGLGFGVWV